MRLPKVTCSPALVAGWCDAVVDGHRWVVFDNNLLMTVGRDQWPDLWKADAEARARLGLPRLDAPPWSDDRGGRARGPS